MRAREASRCPGRRRSLKLNDDHDGTSEEPPLVTDASLLGPLTPTRMSDAPLRGRLIQRRTSNLTRSTSFTSHLVRDASRGGSLLPRRGSLVRGFARCRPLCPRTRRRLPCSDRNRGAPDDLIPGNAISPTLSVVAKEARHPVSLPSCPRLLQSMCPMKTSIVSSLTLTEFQALVTGIPKFCPNAIFTIAGQTFTAPEAP